MQSQLRVFQFLRKGRPFLFSSNFVFLVFDIIEDIMFPFCDRVLEIVFAVPSHIQTSRVLIQERGFIYNMPTRAVHLKISRDCIVNGGRWSHHFKVNTFWVIREHVHFVEISIETKRLGATDKRAEAVFIRSRRFELLLFRFLLRKSQRSETMTTTMANI